MSGLYAGFVANNLALTEHPVHAEVKRPGGILYRDGIAKVAQFSRACNDDGIPIVWLQDIAGFDIGPEAEKEGLLGYGSSLIYGHPQGPTGTRLIIETIEELALRGGGHGLFVGCAALWWAYPGRPDLTRSIAWAVVLATVGAEMSIVFNNAQLPNIVRPERMGWLSGFGRPAGTRTPSRSATGSSGLVPSVTL